MRAVASAVPPAAVGTRILTGLVGQDCAGALPPRRQTNATPANAALSIGNLPIVTGAMRCGAWARSYYGLSLAARATSAHFCNSDLICAVNSAGVLPTASAPSAAIRFCISGDLSAAAI